MHASMVWLMGSDGNRSRRPALLPARARKRLPAEDFAYRVELWDAEKKKVEQVLAVAASAAIAHAAFYAAAREYSDRFITLTHKTSVINRWNAPAH